MIGKATKKEQAYIIENAQHTANEGVQQHGVVSRDKALQMVFSVLEQGGFYLVYRDSHRSLAGWILIGENVDFMTDHIHAFIYELYVLPAYRGEGIGKSLMKSAINICKKRGYKEICLNVYAGNKAKQMYEQFGFSDVQTVMRKQFD